MPFDAVTSARMLPLLIGTARASLICKGQPLDGGLAAGLQDGAADEFVAAQLRQNLAIGQERPEPPRGFHKHGIAYLLAMQVVGPLELVEVDHHHDHLASAGLGTAHQLCHGRIEAGPVQAPGQGVGVGKALCGFLGPAPLAQLCAQRCIAAPPRNEQRDIEHQGIAQQDIGAA